MSQWRLTLSPVPGTVPVEVRIRGALKVLLRRFGLRASNIEMVKAEDKSRKVEKNG